VERLKMFTEEHGNLLEADVDALVNTVNTVGVMGKGLALQFRRAYPAMFAAYERAAKAGEVNIGHMHVWPTDAAAGPRYVINFPTKGHWRSPSRLGDIEQGLRDLVRVIKDLDIGSVAVPPLGCGNGGLEWGDVAPLIRSALSELDDVRVVIYPPGQTPGAAAMPDATNAPAMTPARAALIHLLTRYEERALGASLIEVQKLLYLLQVAGEPLRLRYERGRYGPYADNLRHALKNLEGHYVLGFGDGSARVTEAEPIRVLTGADDAARVMLSQHPQTAERIDRVLDLIDGYESAYGMELLASVLWIAQESPLSATDADVVVRLVREWTSRKGRMFTAAHIRGACEALRHHGWLLPPKL
jgi:O-acetyl-ADP-ribose deacetylase (regulator of RNase III)